MFLRQDEDMDPCPPSTPGPHENLPQSSHIQERQQVTPEEKEPQPSPIPKERGPQQISTTEDFDVQLTTPSEEKEPQISCTPKDGEQPTKQEPTKQERPIPKELYSSLGISCDDMLEEVNFSTFNVYILCSGHLIHNIIITGSESLTIEHIYYLSLKQV